MENLSGRSLGRYHILEPLGEGGMAVVYKAFDTLLERHVAIKVIRLDAFPPIRLGNVLQRFKRETKMLAKLSHPNIVKVLDSGEEKSIPYLVMEYLPGGTLKQMMQGKHMNWRDAARLLLPVCRALKHAHESGIIHRDIKPSNILLSKSAEPMLTDFGIAKIIEGDEITFDLTGTSVGIGTPEYMSPEQGTGKVNERSDIYALGVVFYQMVTGRLPYKADTPLAIMLKKNNEPLPRPSQFVRDLPEGVERFLIKALQTSPANRHSSMDEFSYALEQIADGKPPLEEKLPNKMKPSLQFVLIGTIGLIGIIGAFIFAGFIYKQITKIPITPAQAEELTPPPNFESVNIADTQSLDTLETAIVDIPSADEAEMILIPAGEFLRGVSSADLAELANLCPNCSLKILEDAQPQTTIYLDSFWIDKTEVTNAQFSRFVDETGFRTTAERTNDYSYVQDPGLRDFVYIGDADWQHPQGGNSDIVNQDYYAVTQISWQDANAYCEWAGKRLPTEAEWEKAARGNDGRLFPWGNRSPHRTDLNFDFSPGYIVSVGSYFDGASPYGVLDMSGNVWEWVADYYAEDYYRKAPDDNPQGPPNEEGRVMRGGSWASEYDPYLPFVTTFYRLWNYEYISSDVLGFRCASSR